MLNFVQGGRRDGLGTLLCLDMATHCGWACAHEDGRIASGAFDFSPKPGQREGRRFFSFRIALINFHKGLGPGARVRVFYEDVMFGAPKQRDGKSDGSGGGQTQLAAQMFGGWKAILMSWAETHDFPYEGVHTGTWKKYVVGNGHATKQDVRAAVTQLGHRPATFDESDALGILYYALGVEKNERLMRSIRS